MTEVDISRLANIRPSSISWTGRRSPSSQFVVHTVMNHAYITARVSTNVCAMPRASTLSSRWRVSWLTLKT